MKGNNEVDVKQVDTFTLNGRKSKSAGLCLTDVMHRHA